MGFFNDDPFDELIRDFFGHSSGGRRREQFIKGEDEDRFIDFVEDDKNVYLVFELPGYSEKDVLIEVKGNKIKVIAQKRDSENAQSYLSQKLRKGIVIEKTLPSVANPKKFTHTFKNGTLEVVFKRK